MKASIGIAIAGLVWSSTYGWTQPKERCDKRAAEFLNREYSLWSNTKDEFHYENHYRSRLNKGYLEQWSILTPDWAPSSGWVLRSIDCRLHGFPFSARCFGTLQTTPSPSCR